MISSKELIKNFENFCKMAGGKFENILYPKCSKTSFSISLNISESNDSFERLVLRIESISGDYEEIKLKNIKILNVERLSEEDEKGVIAYYTLNIFTDKGILSLKKAIREDKLLIIYKSDITEYISSIIF